MSGTDKTSTQGDFGSVAGGLRLPETQAYVDEVKELIRNGQEKLRDPHEAAIVQLWLKKEEEVAGPKIFQDIAAELDLGRGAVLDKWKSAVRKLRSYSRLAEAQNPAPEEDLHGFYDPSHE